VASNIETGFAYIIPACQTQRDIYSQLGCEFTFATTEDYKRSFTLKTESTAGKEFLSTFGEALGETTLERKEKVPPPYRVSSLEIEDKQRAEEMGGVKTTQVAIHNNPAQQVEIEHAHRKEFASSTEGDFGPSARPPVSKFVAQEVQQGHLVTDAFDDAIDVQKHVSMSPPTIAFSQITKSILAVEQPDFQISGPSSKLSAFVKRVFRPKQKEKWLDPELSVGRHVGGSFGIGSGMSYWEIKGPARELLTPLLHDIQHIIVSQSENIIPSSTLIIDMFMVGKEVASARPTILMSCEDSYAGKRVLQAVENSSVLDRYPGVAIAANSRVPLGSL
jgi:hypothetical protein